MKNFFSIFKISYDFPSVVNFFLFRAATRDVFSDVNGLKAATKLREKPEQEIFRERR